MQPELIDIDHRAIQEYGYAVVNPLQVDEGEFADLPTTPIVPEPFRMQPHLFPVLLVLDELDFDTRIGLLNRMRAWEIGSEFPFFSALIKSDATPLRMQRHLARQMMRQHRDGVDLLRPFDPRVFRHLTWLLTNEQMDALLGPIEAWAWREPGGRWRQNIRRQISHAQTPRLNEAQWNSYARLGLVNRLIAKLHHVVPELNEDARRAREMDHFLDAAERIHHLADTDDRCLFAEQAVRYHPRIHMHRALADRLINADAGQTSYVRACADLDEPTMRQLVHDIELQGIERIAP